MKTFFYVDGGDFLCELGSETYKIGESLNSFIDLYSLDFIQDLYGDVGFTREIIEEAIAFGLHNGYMVQSYS
jgi:hypothetical protein